MSEEMLHLGALMQEEGSDEPRLEPLCGKMHPEDKILSPGIPEELDRANKLLDEDVAVEDGGICDRCRRMGEATHAAFIAGHMQAKHDIQNQIAEATKKAREEMAAKKKEEESNLIVPPQGFRPN